MIAKSDIPKGLSKIGIVNISDSEMNQLYRYGGVKAEESMVDY